MYMEVDEMADMMMDMEVNKADKLADMVKWRFSSEQNNLQDPVGEKSLKIVNLIDEIFEGGNEIHLLVKRAKYEKIFG